jgi:hypothetical protein
MICLQALTGGNVKNISGINIRTIFKGAAA